jgi:hypothetical protein
MSGPNTASNSSASHIATIASDAHISVTRSCAHQWRLSGTAPDGGCEIVDFSHPPFLVQGFHTACREASAVARMALPETTTRGESGSL